MAKNVKALTKDELAFINSNYIFELKDDYIIVSVKGIDRKVMHEFDKPFSINTSIRKITITVKAIDLWIHNFKDKYSLIEVQNAINTLIVTYQDLTAESISAELNSNVKNHH